MTVLILLLWLLQMSNSHSQSQRVLCSCLMFVNGSNLSMERVLLANRHGLILPVRKLKHSILLRRESEKVTAKNSTSITSSRGFPTDSFLPMTIRKLRIHLKSRKKLSVIHQKMNLCELKSKFRRTFNTCCQQNAIFTWSWTLTGLILNLKTSLTLINSLSKLWSTKFAFNQPRKSLFPI